MKKRILLYFFLTLLSSNLLFSQSLLSETRTWDGDGPDNEWTTILNWSNNLEPEFDADVVININESVNFSPPGDITVESIRLGEKNSTTLSSNLTIAVGNTLTTTKGGAYGSSGMRLDGISSNESVLTVNGTFNIEAYANGHGIDINKYCEVVVGSNGNLNVAASVGETPPGTAVNDGISISDDLTNSGTIEITAPRAMQRWN